MLLGVSNWLRLAETSLGTYFVVEAIDDHSRLQMQEQKYTGMSHAGSNGKSAIPCHRSFMATRIVQNALAWADSFALIVTCNDSCLRLAGVCLRVV